MDGEHWSRLKDVFAELIDLPADERAERLTALASTDPDLHRELDGLLSADACADAVLDRFELGSADSPISATLAVLALADDASPDALASDPFGLSGRTVSHFQVRDVLGAGGMGVVYRAEDVQLGRTVALKFLLPQYSLDPVARDRFLQEARAASTLDHPGVCTVYESGVTEDGRLFMAMACYAGETLKARLARRGPLPLDEVMRIAVALLRALGAAHAAGIVHRDLKPGNVIFTADDAVKILDFGLAKVRDLTITAPGQHPGTAAYMSPEQIQGAPLDQRSDLWSFGIVLYEMLTGRHPFGGGHGLPAVYAILNTDPPAPSHAREGIPAVYDRVVAGLLRKNPDERFATADDVLAAIEHDAAPPARDSDRSWPRRHRIALGIGVLSVAVAAAAVVANRMGALSRDDPAASESPASADTAADRVAIAVLPFADMSATRDQEYFSDGVAEEILNALAQLPGVQVPARSSSFSFKGTSVPLAEIARRLGVDAVLEGSVRKSGDRVRIAVQLVDARADRQLWSRTFDREVKDIFAVQSEIARTVAEAMQVRLERTQLASAPPTASADAHDLYLKGRFHWNRRTAGDLEQAIRYFDAATRVDSSYARAYAGIALAYAVLPLSGSPVSADEALVHVEAAATRALALDSSLAEAHAARGYAYHWTWRWADADREFQRAIALDPTDVTSRQWYGEHAAKMGRFAEGEAQLRRALALDPLSLGANNDLGIVLMLARRYGDAVAQLEKAHGLDTTFGIPMLLLHRVHILAGDADAAAAAGRGLSGLTYVQDPEDYATLALATRDTSRRAEALGILARWERQTPARWADVAMYYAVLGERDRAIAALEQGLRAHTPMMAGIRVAPWLDPLRSDARFQRIVTAMRFP